MSTTYRPSRNIEASFVDYLTDNFNTDWTNVSVKKGMAQVYSINLPVVCIRCGITEHAKAEIGGNATIRTAQVLIDIFCTSDGQKLDMLDYVVKKIKAGIPYYDYEIENGTVKTKLQNGRLRVMDIDVTNIDFNVDKNKLDIHDRYRGLITLSISLGRVEV